MTGKVIHILTACHYSETILYATIWLHKEKCVKILQRWLGEQENLETAIQF